jgi:hypothetical protein
MDDRLADLARRLDECRKVANRMTLANVLESAQILTEAKRIAKGAFTRWLRTTGGMDPSTARRHLAVASFVSENGALTHELARLSIAKVYALTTLDFETARGYLTGAIVLSRPLDQMSDVQFAREFRRRHPRPRQPQTRKRIYQEVYSAIVRLRIKLQRGERYASALSPAQHRKIVEAFEALLNEAAGWKVVA